MSRFTYFISIFFIYIFSCGANGFEYIDHSEIPGPESTMLQTELYWHQIKQQVFTELRLLRRQGEIPEFDRIVDPNVRGWQRRVYWDQQS